MILRDALITNSSLESITVLGNATFESITGWRAFCSIFAHKMCTIKHLWIQETSIYNEGATILGDALPISQDNSITSVGWQGFSTCLRGQNSALEKLYIGMCRMDDEGSGAIISALANNTTLSELTLNNDQDSFPNILSRILSVKTCIDNTHSSNHTLCEVAPFYLPLKKDIRRLLKMNRNMDKVEVARQKILQKHFSEGNANIHVFATMPETSLPFGIAWIGRNNDGRTLMYNFAQAFLSLLDISHKYGVNKRKR